MSKQHRSEAGFGLAIILICVLVVAAVVSVGVYMFSKNQNATNTKTAHATQTTQSDQSTYLNIPEIGIRIKLTANIKDAYYAIGDGSNAGSAGVRLNVRSLSAYEGCTPAGGGVAAIGSFKKGDSDPIVGDYATAFPNALKVGDYYYYISGNQYDCTGGKASTLYSNVKDEFVSAALELLPKQ